ncbi:Shedu anti-phage system protein SduA domain-containing protein [Lentzea sp. NPDC051838]|uniref:Shedu anti-phage system protein SduA domain-containing protein n=1 Tax=Lentzea sp. NPDC051838 TaxID=3154849 RepID=UPI00343B3C3A
MPIRSDWTLEIMLEQARDACVNDDARDSVIDALKHMNSGKSSRRGGRHLVELIQAALNLAERTEDSAVVERLRDGIDYAEGRKFKQDMDDRYPMFREQRSDLNLGFLRDMLTATLGYSTAICEEFLREHPSATGAELVDHLRNFELDVPFIDAPAERPGRYRLVRGRAESAAWIAAVLTDRLDVEDVDEAARKIVTNPAALAALAADEGGEVILQAMELKRRQSGLTNLRAVVEDPNSSEHDIHRALRDQLWIFGGRFVGEARNRRLVEGDELDIPLLRPDGTLCLVELKRADERVVKRHRGAWVATAVVHAGVSQALNYLCGLDENRSRVISEFSIDARRANAIVLIGHPKFQPEVPEPTINEALRIQNAHLTRVEVLTYKELLDAAERSLSSDGQTLKRNSTTSPSAIT